MPLIAKFLLGIAVIGALNWGLIGFFNFNLVDAIFGGGIHEETSSFSRIIYALVGLCGLAGAYYLSQVRTLDTPRATDTTRTGV